MIESVFGVSPFKRGAWLMDAIGLSLVGAQAHESRCDKT